MEEITPHSEHNSKKYPVLGCLECDKEINRPIYLSFGNGKSNRVIPREQENGRN